MPSSSRSPRIFFPSVTPYVSLSHGLRDPDDSRSEDDEQEGREDEQHEREEHLDRRFVGRLFGPLPALRSELVGLHTQHLRDADTQLLSLNNAVNKRGQLLDSDALFEFPHRLSPHLAHRNVAQHAGELLSQRAAALLRYAGKGGIQTEAGLHAGRDQIHRVRHGADYHLLAGLDLALEPDTREDEAEGSKHDDENELHKEAAGKAHEHDQARSRARGADDAPEGEVALEGHRVARHHQLLLDVGQHRGRQYRADRAREAPNRRPQHSLAEGKLQVDLVRFRGNGPATEVLYTGLHAGAALAAAKHGVDDRHYRPEDGYGCQCDDHFRLLNIDRHDSLHGEVAHELQADRGGQHSLADRFGNKQAHVARVHDHEDCEHEHR